MFKQTVMSIFGRSYCCHAHWLECLVFKNYRKVVDGFMVADHNLTFRNTKCSVLV